MKQRHHIVTHKKHMATRRPLARLLLGYTRAHRRPLSQQTHTQTHHGYQKTPLSLASLGLGAAAALVFSLVRHAPLALPSSPLLSSPLLSPL